MRLWGVVLLGNILGTGIAAWAFEYMPIFNEETRDAFVKIGMDVMKTPQRDVCQRDYLRLADSHNGMDVPCGRSGKDCGNYINDVAYRPG